jgi:pimeloyl-ACP methyl ester carboxylesterase
MLLSLAAEDPAPNVVYLARPCQYTPEELRSGCREFFWTQGRFAEPVIASMNQAVEEFVKKVRAPAVHLIGYSGGAAVAVLVAVRRQDIASLRTIAGNLDPQVVNEYNGVSPLEGSLDPSAVASRIAGIPQLHFLGGDDETIPFSAAESFLKKMGSVRCFQTKTLPDATHDRGWREAWPGLLALPVACRE